MQVSKVLVTRKYRPEEWISRDEAVKLLGIKSNTLSVYISTGKIPLRYISKTVTGSKIFYKPGLLGFDN